MKVWKYLHTGTSNAEKNMAIDCSLLQDLQYDGEPTLHIYDWEESSLTYGHFICLENFLLPKGIQKHKRQIARRPTGGGILLHGSDFTFSVLLPGSHPSFSRNTLSNYQFINQTVLETLHCFLGGNAICSLLPEEPEKVNQQCVSFCMAKPTKYDLMINGKKVGGGALRKTKEGFLHQGSICLTLPSEEFLNALFPPQSIVVDAMRQNSYPLLGSKVSLRRLEETKTEISKQLFLCFSKTL
jgi:lipoate---protein ligase